MKKLSFAKIAERVENRKKETPSEWLVRDVYSKFNRRSGRCKYNYKNCGRKPWKVTPEVRKFLIKKLLAERNKDIVTSTVLQRALVREHAVELEASTIRKVLKKAGYRWMARAQKTKYSKEVRKQRLLFADFVLRLSMAQLCARLCLAMDGVILTMPPASDIGRENYCQYGHTHCYRKPSERAIPELAGADAYAKQVPLERAIPLWGGCSAGGFSAVTWHPEKKLDEDEWAKLVRNGSLVRAIKALKPVNKKGPWWVLCDNESFLRTDITRKAHREANIKLWGIPPKSPDLNPVEKFWGWLRRRLRKLDYADLRNKRPVPGKMAYKMRVQRVLKSRAAQTCAANCARGLLKVCQIVHDRKGAHSGR